MGNYSLTTNDKEGDLFLAHCSCGWCCEEPSKDQRRWAVDDHIEQDHGELSYLIAEVD